MQSTILYGIFFGILHTGTSKRYHYEGTKGTFNEAQELCGSLNMDVAIASTDDQIEEMNSQLSYLSKDAEAWLGFVYTGEGREFKWTNGEPETSARWDTVTDNEPDQLSFQTCAVWRRRDYLWDSRQCGKEYLLVCSSKDNDDLIYATFTLYKKDKQIVNQDSDIVTSRSNIDCAVACRKQSNCSAFTIASSNWQCFMFSFVSIDAISFSSSPGSNVWKRN